jgi:hypothetical protein
VNLDLARDATETALLTCVVLGLRLARDPEYAVHLGVPRERAAGLRRVGERMLAAKAVEALRPMPRPFDLLAWTTFGGDALTAAYRRGGEDAFVAALLAHEKTTAS